MPGLMVTQAQCNQLGVEFALTELDLAITFCQVGLTTRDFDRAERNVENARVALQSVLHVKEHLSLDEQERKTVSAKTSQVAFLLVQLERRLVLSCKRKFEPTAR